MEGRVPGLVGHICPDYGIADEARPEASATPTNVDVFLKEFHEFEQNGNLPRLIVMSLGEDHTTGTTAGDVHAAGLRRQQRPGPRAAGRGGVSKSKYWKETAIFVIEDDAQNGPDHVDAHRTVGLVISPYTQAARTSTARNTAR